MPLAVPGLMSLNSMVPLAVPSVVHNSLPCWADVATKKTLLFNTVNPIGVLFACPVLISLIIIVPDSVPSVRQSSRPSPGVTAEK